VNNDEHQHIPDILDRREHTCAECGKPFVATSQWLYKLSHKGRTIWFCRWNCVRAGEKKIDSFKVTRGKGRGKKEMAVRPPKEELENDLRSGMNGHEIAKKYGASSVQSVHNWIKKYGLKGIKGKGKDEDIVKESVPTENVIQDAPPVDDMVQAPQSDDMVQDSPAPAEIEQFHTDEPVQELPVVEMNPSETYHVPPETQGMTEEEWGSQEGISFVDVTPEPNPAPRETFDEIWQDVRDDLATLERLYVADAKKSFREHLREMLVEIVGTA